MQARFDVEHVEIASTGDGTDGSRRRLDAHRAGDQRLSGASVVREDARQAVIRAVLAAVNRRLGPARGRGGRLSADPVAQVRPHWPGERGQSPVGAAARPRRRRPRLATARSRR